MKILKYLILILIFTSSYSRGLAQYSTFCDTLYVDVRNMMKIAEAVESIEPYEKVDIKTCIKIIQSHEMKAVVEFIRISSAEITRVEMESLGIDKETNYYAFVITIDYIPDKSKENYEAKATEVHK